VEWLIALVALDLVFAAFVVLQLATLFGGHDYVVRTTGLTYAQYARHGFAQLLAVAALTLAVVAGARRYVRDELLLRALLGVLCLFTLVVLVSAHRRLGLYVDAYGATRLRLLAQAQVLWLGAVFVLVLAAGTSVRAPWLPRAVAALSALAALLFVAVDPDRRIAARNVDRYAATGRIDRAYLDELSADAAPALLRLPRPLRCAVIAVPPRDALAGYNFSRRRARALLEEPFSDCAQARS
jgi:hypothetical protein